MRTMLLSALALGALTTAALAAEPPRLTADQLDKIKAGQTFEPVFSTTQGDKSGQNLHVAEPAADNGNFASAIENSPILVKSHGHK